MAPSKSINYYLLQGCHLKHEVLKGGCRSGTRKTNEIMEPLDGILKI